MARNCFGSVTGQNSFDALNRLDWPENGGNMDGILDNHDREWSRLRLWVDLDHDGRADRSHEIKTLASQGIKRLQLDFVEISQAASGGNRIDFRGTYVRRSPRGETFWDMYGVTFLKR